MDNPVIREVPPFIGRLIWNNEPVGTGFLIHQNGLIATCAHVVEDRETGEIPVGEVLIFEFLSSGQRRRVKVTNKFNQKYDVVLLQLSGSIPEEVKSAVLIQSSAAKSGMGFQVTGYGQINDPNHQFDFSSATGVVVGPTLRDGVHLLQLDSKQIVPGMSGGPVMVEELNGVVGVISGRYNQDPRTGFFMRDTVWAAKSEDLAVLDQNLSVRVPKQPLPRWMTYSAMGIVLTLSLILAWAWFTRVTPLPEGGFNVVIADFATLDEQGTPIRLDLGTQISMALFETLKIETAQLPPALRPNIRGPDEVPPIDDGMGEANVEAIAREHNATILIYGVVQTTSNGYQVELGFEIPAQEFNYGSEIIGPTRLGEPIPFSIDSGGKYQTNETLDARTLALRYLVSGLAYFSINDYERAVVEFRSAANAQNWLPEDGKEVAQMFVGTALLRDYDPITGPEQNLIEARLVLSDAIKSNPDYARSYLVLGAIAREEAVLHGDSCSGQVTTKKLAEAEKWYTQSLNAPDQAPNAYIPAKAYFGLGQINLLIFCNQFPGAVEAKEKAADDYSQVIEFYEKAGKPIDLAWFAGFSYAERGWLASNEEDWETMLRDTNNAIEILRTLPGEIIRKWLAREYAQKGSAEKELCLLDAARTSYQQALIQADEAEENSVSVGEQEQWKAELEMLEDKILKGGTCGTPSH